MSAPFSLVVRSAALGIAGVAVWSLLPGAAPTTDEVLMRYPFYHRETLRVFEQLNQHADGRPERPSLRPLDIVPLSEASQVYYALTDPTRVSPGGLRVTPAAVRVLHLLDGTRSLDEVAARAAELLPGPGIEAQVRQLVGALSGNLFLFDGAYRTAVIRLVTEFARATERAPITMGSSYPEDGAAAREQVLGYLDGNGGAAAGRPRGLIAPHIDYQRGHATYGKAYAALRGVTGVRRFIILGTAHSPSLHRFAATRKNYRTSLGAAITDGDFLDRLARRYPHPLFEDEFLHRGEHSIELEIPFLQALFGADVRIVPLLCGSLHDVFARKGDPLSDPEIHAFVSALRETIAESDGESVLIAAADLSHMGPHFGDDFVMDDARLARLRQDDQVLLDRLAAGDARGFVDALSASSNATRVCGAAPIYTLLQVVGATAAVQVLGYEQCTDPERFTTVTIPAAVVTS